MGRSPSLLGKVVGGQEKESKRIFNKRMSRDIVKRNGEPTISHLNQLTLTRFIIVHFSQLPVGNAPSQLSRNSNPRYSGHLLHQSVSAISSSARALRRVHSSTGLRVEGALVLQLRSWNTRNGGVQKKGPIASDMNVRGFDSSLAFAEGR